jgi:hypothetical protein
MSLVKELAGSKLVRAILLLTALLHLGIQLFYWLPRVWSRQDIQRDMTVYYQAAQKAQAHRPLYHPLVSNAPDFNRGAYIYPPQFAIVVSPVARLPYLTYARLVYLLEIAAFWSFALALVMLAGARRTVENVLLWGVLLGITPGTSEAMTLGQVDPLLWALFGFALCTRHRGLLLGISAQIKPFALLVVAIAAWRERGRVLWPAAAVIGLGVLLGAVVYGPMSFVRWAQWGLPIPTQGSFDPNNISLTYAGLRLARALGCWVYTGGELPLGARLYLAVAGLLGVACAAYWGRRLTPAMHYAVTLVVGVLCSPLCWITYLPLALVPFALFIQQMRSPAETPLEPKVLSAAS